MRYLLDSNVVIGLLNDATSKLARRARREKPADVVISAIVAHELFYGAFKSRRTAQSAALTASLQFEVLEFDKEDARRPRRFVPFWHPEEHQSVHARC